jgi:hypothetical protein
VHEHTQLLTFLDIEDAGGEAVELLLARLDHLVAGQAIQDMLGALPVWLMAGKPERRMIPASLRRNRGNLHRAGVVGQGGIQPVETSFPHQLALGVVAFDAQIIQVGGAVHGGA